MPRKKPQKKSTKTKCRPECGKSVGILCSELFREKYDIDRITGFVLSFAKKFEFHEFFDDLPRDEEEPNRFETRFLESYAKGLLEYVQKEIAQRERKNPNYAFGKLNTLVYKILESFFTRARKDMQKSNRLQVNEKRLQEIRWWLKQPDITLTDLWQLAVKPFSAKGSELFDELKRYPGYRHVWFKIEREKGEKKLFMYKTKRDTEEEYEFLTRPRRDLGHRRIKYRTESGQFDETSKDRGFRRGKGELNL